MASKEAQKSCPEGCVQKQLAQYLKDDVKTAVKFYSNNIHRHSMECRVAVNRGIYESAIKGNINAIQFWLCCFGGWKESTGDE